MSISVEILQKAEEYGGHVSRHIFYGFSEEGARHFHAWAQMFGHDPSFPTRTGSRWSVTVTVRNERA